MKAVILAGGYGTRISEESGVRPKPMVEIGDLPVLWHIMKIYASHGITDFVICCGYKGHIIKQWALDYFWQNSDFTVDLRHKGAPPIIHRACEENWKITVLDTGLKTMTGGRIKRAIPYVGNETFCCTYGDGVSDIDIKALLDFHREQGALATMTAVQPPGRFGAFTLAEGQTKAQSFREKPQGDGSWINGGFFVLEPSVADFIVDDDTVWEQEPLERLASSGNLAAYRHRGFWMPMDTLRDAQVLREMWDNGTAKWKVWS